MSAAALWLWESRAQGEDPLLDVFPAQGLSRAGDDGTAEGDDVKEQHDQPHVDTMGESHDSRTASAAPARAHLQHCGVDMWGYEAPGVYDGVAFWTCPTCGAWTHRFADGTPRRRAAERYADYHRDDLPEDKRIRMEAEGR